MHPKREKHGDYCREVCSEVCLVEILNKTSVSPFAECRCLNTGMSPGAQLKDISLQNWADNTRAQHSMAYKQFLPNSQLAEPFLPFFSNPREQKVKTTGY